MTFSVTSRDLERQATLHNQLLQNLDTAQQHLDENFRDVELLANTVEAFQETLHQASVQSILSNSAQDTTPQMACQTSENLLRTLIPALRAQTHVFNGESKGKFRTAIGKLNRLNVQLLREKAELMLNNLIAQQSKSIGAESKFSAVLQTAISKEELQREMNALTERHEQVASQFLQAEEVNTSLRDEIARLRDDVTELQRRLETRDEKLQIAQRQQSHMKRDMKRLAQEVTSLRDANEQLKKDHDAEMDDLETRHTTELSEKVYDLDRFSSHSEQLQTMAQFFQESVTNATMESLTATCPTMNAGQLCDLSNKTLSELSGAVDEKSQSLQEFTDAPDALKKIGAMLYEALSERIRLTKLLNISCWAEIQVGDFVMLSEGRTGEVKYVGPIDGKPQDMIWYGIELSVALGAHNGTLNGRKYFRAPPNCGIFVLRNRIMRILEQKGDMIRVSNRDIQELQGRLVTLERVNEQQKVQLRALEEIRKNLSAEVVMLSSQHQSLLDQNESMMSLNKHLKLQVRDYLRKELSVRSGNGLSPSSVGAGRLGHRSDTFDESQSAHYGGWNGDRGRLNGLRAATFVQEDSYLVNDQDDAGYRSS